MSRPSDYLRVTSQDGYEFYMEKTIAPKGLPEQLPYPMRIAEKIIQYLHYRHQNIGRDLNQLPAFELDPAIALEVLRASIELKI